MKEYRASEKMNFPTLHEEEGGMKRMTLRKKANQEHNTLQIKILSGYLLLFLLVGSIIVVVWYEKQVFERAEVEERVVLEQHQLSNRIFKSLLSLFLDNEYVTHWDDNDLQTYQNRQKRVFLLLEELRNTYPDSMQAARIDTVKTLLFEKEKHLKLLVKTPSTVSRIDSFLSKELPLLAVPVSTSQKQEEKEAKKKGIFSWLKRKKKESPSPKQNTYAYKVRQFRDGVSTTLHYQEKYMENLTDSLEIRNRGLNRNISRLINEFEKEAMRRTVQRHDSVSNLREQAFRMICILSSAGILCIFFLYIVIYKDVKQKHNYQYKLEEADRHKQRVLEQRKKIMLTLAHDIRGPLNSINGGAELALDTRDKKKRNMHLENIRSSCTHILHLVNNLLDVYRLDECKDTLNSVPFNLGNLLERISMEYRLHANSKGLLFDKVSKGTEVTLKGDADRIEQIAGNLLSNAIKFTPSGKIQFVANYINNILCMEVSDTGIGMKEEDVERIFYPFERADQSINAEGFGLGLPITKGLVKLLNGNICVVSKLGKGSTFTVQLPLATTEEEVTDFVISHPLALPAELKVLVIDDDPMQLHIVREMLERKGVSCTACIHIRELVEKIRETDYQLILTDIQMKDTNGFDLLKLLRSAHLGNSQSVPVVAMTARGDTRCETFAKAGFAGCIYKPFSMTELLNTVGMYTSQKDIVLRECADLSVLTADVRNPIETMDIFICDCKHEHEALTKLFCEDNRKEIQKTIHRLMPLWEMIGRESPLLELSVVLRDSDCSKEKVKEAAERVLANMKGIIIQAEAWKGELENERDTDR